MRFYGTTVGVNGAYNRAPGTRKVHSACTLYGARHEHRRAMSMTDHHTILDSPLRHLGPRCISRILEGSGPAVPDLRESSSGGCTATPTALVSSTHLPY